jgi:phospholipid/cholesterol/gamma-HCH transport system permease protein
MTGTFAFILTMPYSEMQVDQTKTFSDIGNWLVEFFEWFGHLALFCGRLIRSAVTPPYEIREFVHQFDELGSKSLPLVALAGAATGIVLTLSTRPQASAQNSAR